MFSAIKIKGSLFFLMCLIAIFPNYGNTKVSAESQLKSVFLFNFVRLIEWPQNLKSSDSFNLCSLENSEINDDLLRLQNRVVRNKTVNVRFISDLKSADSCGLVYLEKGMFDVANLSTIAKQNGVLLVSDKEDFVSCYGHIEIVVNPKKSNKLSLRVNKTNTDKDSFRVSSRILMRSTVLNTEECSQSGLVEYQNVELAWKKTISKLIA